MTSLKESLSLPCWYTADHENQNSGWVYYGGTSTTTDANGNKIYSGTILSSSAITFNPPLHAWPYAVISLTPPEPVAKQQVTFSGLGSSCYNASGAVTCPSNAYQWYNLDTNPKTTGSSAPTFVTTYPVLGSHSEQLVVTDLEGNSCSATTSFTVKSPSDVPQWKEISPF